MPSATILPPASFASQQGTVGQAYVFAEEAIRQELTERLNVLAMGLVMGVGDLQGRGSDVIRVTRFGGIGFDEQMTAMADETAMIPTTGHTLGHDTVTIARYGLAKEETYQSQILGRAEALGLEDMVIRAPNSWLATLRANVATEVSTFASGVGTSGAAWTYDDELELVAAFHETEGFNADMGVVSMRHPEQYTDLRNSVRNEPGLQNDASLQMLLQGLGQGQDPSAFPFLRIMNHSSFDVVTSSGDHVGGAYVPGAVAWVVANTLPITVDNPTMATFVPEFGIVIERKSTGEVGTAKFVMNAFFGTDKLDPSLFPQFKITSVND